MFDLHHPSVAPDPVQVAVLGTGFGRKVHIPGLQAHPDARVAAVYHPDRAKAVDVAKDFEIPKVYDQLDDLLADPAIQGVTIATPPHVHFEMAQQALLAGKHVLLEKPITLNVGQALQLDQLAYRQSLIVTPDFEFRFVPEWQYLKRLLDEGWLGSIRSVNHTWQVQSRADPSRPWNWYAQRHLGGGALGAMGSHAFDMMAWLFGPIDRLTAQLSTRIPTLIDPQTSEAKPVTSDDTCHMILILKNGIPIQISLSAVTYAGRGHWLEIYGDQGTFILGSGNLKDYIHGFHLQAARPGQDLQHLPIPLDFQFERTYPDGRQAPFMRVVTHWIHCIRTGQHLEPNLQNGIYAQHLMDQAWLSHDQTSWVSIPDLDAHHRFTARSVASRYKTLHF